MKILYLEINKCDDCPYSKSSYNSDKDIIVYKQFCNKSNKIITKNNWNPIEKRWIHSNDNNIPDWCELENK